MQKRLDEVQLALESFRLEQANGDARKEAGHKDLHAGCEEEDGSGQLDSEERGPEEGGEEDCEGAIPLQYHSCQCDSLDCSP